MTDSTDDVDWFDRDISPQHETPSDADFLAAALDAATARAEKAEVALAASAKREEALRAGFSCMARAGTEQASELAAARVEVDRLRALIVRHRARVWGDDTVGHPEDAELYRAAGRGEGK